MTALGMHGDSTCMPSRVKRTGMCEGLSVGEEIATEWGAPIEKVDEIGVSAVAGLVCSRYVFRIAATITAMVQTSIIALPSNNPMGTEPAETTLARISMQTQCQG